MILIWQTLLLLLIFIGQNAIKLLIKSYSWNNLHSMDFFSYLIYEMILIYKCPFLIGHILFRIPDLYKNSFEYLWLPKTLRNVSERTIVIEWFSFNIMTPGILLIKQICLISLSWLYWPINLKLLNLTISFTD